MDDLLNNKGNVTTPSDNYQGVFPEVGFTCDGKIQSWVFGAEWREWMGQESFSLELQIWRPAGDGVYTKIGNTTIMTARENSGLYEYNLSSPLVFQDGDVLGYYQPTQSQLRLWFEKNGRGRTTGYFYSGTSADSDLYLPSGVNDDAYQPFVNVNTGEYNKVVFLMI